MNNNSNEKIDIKKYQDQEGVTMDKLNFGLWWTKNKSNFRNTLIAILILLAVISWSYTIFSWGFYYLLLEKKDDDMIRVLAQTTTVSNDFLIARSAQRLSISPVYMLEAGDKYDFYAIIKNPNDRYYGLISYCFLEGSTEIECGESFVLPATEKYVISLANEIDHRPSNIKFQINNKWAVLDNHRITDWESYKEEHLDFSTKDLKFTPASNNELTEKINLNTFEFTITNGSPYNYYELPLNIILFRSQKIVAINKYVIKDFRSNQEKTIKINWPGYIGMISGAEIKPDINILMNGIYSSN